MPLGTGGGEVFVASVVTEGATGGLAGGAEGETSFRCHFEVKATPLGSSPVLFFIELPPRVWAKIKNKKLIEKKIERKNVNFLAYRGK